MRLDKEEEIPKLIAALANGATDTIPKIVEARLDLEELDKQAAMVKEIKADLFEKAQEE